MSAHEEKLQASQPTQGTRARATLAQLRKRWGFPSDTGADSPEIQVTAMGAAGETWVLISGRGESAVFEQVS